VMESVLVLVLAYVALTALLAATLIRARLHWGLKLLLVTAACGLYFVCYQGWREVQGWPVSSQLPKRFLLHASVVDEPDKSSGKPGEIFIWASDLIDGKPAKRPRAYRVDYDKALHSNLTDALRNMRNGVVQLGRIRQDNEPVGLPRDYTRMGERRERIEIYSLPDPALPEK
jgi:hypothetical protein